MGSLRERPLYASAALGELRVVDLGTRTVEVSTGPMPEGYANTRTVGPNDEIVLSALEGVVIGVAAFLS